MLALAEKIQSDIFRKSSDRLIYCLRRLVYIFLHAGWLLHQRFLALDGLRGFAALVIMFVHLQLTDTSQSLFSRGYLAVDLFFVLSGFVLSHAYDRRLADGLGWRSFLVVRLTRLYPTYFVGILIGGAGIVIFEPHYPAASLIVAALAGLFLVPSPVTLANWAPLFPFDAPTWSLFFELVANGFLAITFTWLSRRNLILLVAVAAACLVIVAIGHGNLQVGWEPSTLVAGLTRAFFSFFAGVLAARAKIPTMPRLLPEMLFLASVLVLMLPAPVRLSGAWDAAVVLLLFPSVVPAMSQVQLGRASATVAQFLGTLSYPLFAIHYPCFYLLKRISPRIPGTSPALLWSGAIIFVIVASYLIGLHFEPPARRWLHLKIGGIAARAARGTREPR